jgi:hypothetical protein
MIGKISGFSEGIGGVKRKLNFFDPAIFVLIAEVGLNFFRFLRSLGLSAGPDLVVLSSKDNYFCNEYELKHARIIVNLKKLNLIKHLDLFLNTMVLILPPDTSFIGYFSDEKALNRSEVSELLEKNGFKTLGMKEINGLIYFISKNVSMAR